MEKYDYLSAVTADVKDYINDKVNFADYEDAEELKEKLQDELWTVDGGQAMAAVAIHLVLGKQKRTFATIPN